MKRKNFTLIELLVIIGILGILAGFLLMPPTGHIDYVPQYTCKNNVKQFAVALKCYSAAYDGKFPSVKAVSGNADSTNSVACLDLLRECKFISDYKLFICPSTTGSAGNIGKPGSADINNGVLTNDTAKTKGTRQVTYVYFEGLTEADEPDRGILACGFGGAEGETERWNHEKKGNFWKKSEYRGNFATAGGYAPSVKPSNMWINEVRAGPGKFTDGVDSPQAKKVFNYVNGSPWITD